MFLSDEEWAPVPAGACEHMFPAWRLLPDLEEVELDHKPAISGCIREPPSMREDDILSLAACCPGLRYVTLFGMTAQHLDYSRMEQLPPAVRRAVGLRWPRPDAA